MSFLRQHYGVITAALRLILGAIFLTSAVLKSFAPQTSSELLTQFLGIGESLSSAIVIVLMLIEGAIAVALISNRFVLAASASSLLLMIFAILVGLVFIDHPVSCGCFGNAFESRTDTFFILRNLAILASSLILLFLVYPPSSHQKSSATRKT